MRLLFADLESYFTKDYSLRKMSTPAYILDPRFELLGVAVAYDLEPARWIDGPDFNAWVAKQDLSRTMVVSHNAMFDASVFAWRYCMQPAMWGDTLSMARATMRKDNRSLSLASLARYLKLPAKEAFTANFINWRYADVKGDPRMYAGLVEYAKHDLDLCRALFLHMHRHIFDGEMRVIDMVIRACVEPQLQLDTHALVEHLHAVQTDKANLMARVAATREDLMSNPKFAAALQELGVEPPLKTSPATGRQTWAFAKNDPEFEALKEHENPEVQTLVAARLGMKSTLEETRCERLLELSRLDWGDGQPWLPVPLNYSGAHTHRLSGAWNLNLQNLTRGSKLRKAIKAPPGYKVVVADASQIEARINAFINHEDKLLRSYHEGADPYSGFASDVFGRKITKADKHERFIGKTCILGLGYGMGWPKFQATVAMQSRLQLGTKLDLSDREARRIVDLYRNTFKQIVGGWRECDVTIQYMYEDIRQRFFGGSIRTEKHALPLPNGLKLFYHNLRQTPDGWLFDYAGQTKKIYGAKLVENIVQALARIHIMEVAQRVKTNYGYDFALQVHDELVYVVADERAEWFKEFLLLEMCIPAPWLDGCPLAAEGGVGDNYGDAKS